MKIIWRLISTYMIVLDLQRIGIVYYNLKIIGVHFQCFLCRVGYTPLEVIQLFRDIWFFSRLYLYLLIFH
jgi:hypothetical protein